MQRDIVPVPVIDEDLCKNIQIELLHLNTIPKCDILRKYFIDQITSSNYSSYPTFLPYDYNQIKASIPQLQSMAWLWPNINKIIDYYVYNYPSYNFLRRQYEEIGMNESILDQWFKEFYCYLKVKIAGLPDMLKKTDAKNATNNMSGICLEITGPNNIVNNLVFSSIGDNIQVRYHKNVVTNVFNNDSSLNTLINYPHIGLEFTIDSLNPQISFTRTCECYYERFVANKTAFTRKSIKPSSPETEDENGLRCIELVDPNEEPVVYTYGFINEYMKSLLQVINNCGKIIPEGRKQELQTVINEFLADIAELNLYHRNVFATNTLVKFGIGNRKYIRNRFVQSSMVTFREELIPIITLHLKHFKPQHTMDRYKVHFKQLDFYSEHLETLEQIFLDKNTLIYTCLLCITKFNTYQDIMEHYNNEHNERTGVVCEGCQQMQEIGRLATNRWKHCLEVE